MQSLADSAEQRYQMERGVSARSPSPRFPWDANNRKEISAHCVTTDEFEQAFAVRLVEEQKLVIGYCGGIRTVYHLNPNIGYKHYGLQWPM